MLSKILSILRKLEQTKSYQSLEKLLNALKFLAIILIARNLLIVRPELSESIRDITEIVFRWTYYFALLDAGFNALRLVWSVIADVVTAYENRENNKIIGSIIIDKK